MMIQTQIDNSGLVKWKVGYLDEIKTREAKAVDNYAIHITPEALDQVLGTVGVSTPESGTICLCSSCKHFGIETCHFDLLASQKGFGSVYDPSYHEYLNQMVSGKGPLFSGYIHSHRGDQYWPSWNMGGGRGDLGVAHAVFQAVPSLQAFYMLIITGVSRQAITLWPWVTFKADPDTPFLAQLRICPVVDFPSYC